MATSEETLLLLLKTAGPLTAGELAARLKLTPQGLRRRLEALESAGYVAQSRPEAAAGVGRPPSHWQLAAAGEARFPDAHDAVTVELIDGIRRELGQSALDRVIAAREKAQLERYAGKLKEHRGLEAKVQALALLRSTEGYMAESRQEPDGSFLLIEHHCPICAAATACQGFCRSELDIFRAALGRQATVEREQHLLAGDRRCVYRIRGKAAG